MEILPSIDLKDGKVVRLAQGDYERQTTYGDDPLSVAQAFVQAGAAWLHVVDLDAARSGRAAHLDVVRRICAAVPAKIECGGGARDDSAIARLLDAGVARVVIGSKATEDWPWFQRLVQRADMAGRLALGLDARGGKLASHGWTRQTELTALDVARRTQGWPLGAIVYTDIARDGLLEGVNVRATAEVLAATDVPVIASGGVGSLDDLMACRKIGCAGAIVGRAYYEGKIDLARAILLTRS